MPLALLLLLNNTLLAQPSSLNFHHLTTSGGLSDPVVRCITQDKYGHIWLGTQNGLNRFNGYDVNIFQHKKKDSFSLDNNNVLSLFCDTDGDLWIGLPLGLSRYDYHTGHFKVQASKIPFAALKMLQADKNNIYVATIKGLALLNKPSGSLTFLHTLIRDDSRALLRQPVTDFCISHTGSVYITTDTGLVVYDPKKITAKKIKLDPVKNNSVNRIILDKGELWISYEENSMLLKTDTGFHSFRIYPQFKNADNNFTDNQINSIFSDNKGRIWVTTVRQGLGLFDSSSNTFNQYVHDPLQLMSPATNFTTFLYQDKEGFIWTGTEGYGTEYFNPDKNLFQSIQQSLNQSPTLPDNWCRTAAEDKDGNLWLGTASGLARYDTKQKTFKIFQNIPGKPAALHANSIRSLLCDDDEVWIGANGGVNRYHISSGKMDFIGANDSLPNSFYWTIIKDHKGDIWFGCRDGLYRYNQKTKKVENFDGNADLAPYSRKNIRSLFEDSHNRLWIGLYFYGVVMYDPANGEVKHFTSNESNEGPGLGIITSIIEDKKGLIWIGTSSGLSSYNTTTYSFKHYLNSESGISEITSSLVCDDQNRLWIAASSGLYLLDSTRTSFKNFGRNEGLPTIDFNTQSALSMRNGTLVYPTMKGFILFNPHNYKTNNDNIRVNITSFKVLSEEYLFATALEQADSLHLGYDQNFFSIQTTAVNYDNPNQNWYAHKLDPFDKEWVYTEDRTVNYTNVTGGDYTFRYKTSSDRNNWNVPEKTLVLHIDTIFYKTFWFRGLALFTFMAIVYWIYRIRIQQKEKLLILEKKAFLLEKEKAMVMYESLKQQLNPHFLFNSLTSLSSLISSNPTHAKRFLDSLSKIYRYILKSRDSETVSLEDEIKLAEIYLQLQQTRFREGLQWTIDIPEDRLHLRIAPVTLQNLAENAIKHNIIDPASPLRIHISEENGWLVVENNLQKKTFVESSNRQGLVNMQSLYNYLTGKKIVTFQDDNHFIIKVPLI